jgi:hypothetical protein
MPIKVDNTPEQDVFLTFLCNILSVPIMKVMIFHSNHKHMIDTMLQIWIVTL